MTGSGSRTQTSGGMRGFGFVALFVIMSGNSELCDTSCAGADVAEGQPPLYPTVAKCHAMAADSNTICDLVPTIAMMIIPGPPAVRCDAICWPRRAKISSQRGRRSVPNKARRTISNSGVASAPFRRVVNGGFPPRRAPLPVERQRRLSVGGGTTQETAWRRGRAPVALPGPVSCPIAQARREVVLLLSPFERKVF